MKSTLVKIFIVLNFLLCAAVLGFSFKTFSDRELVKARSVIHRDSIQRIAQNLEWGEEVAGEEVSDQKMDPFRLPNPGNLADMPAFTAQLEELSGLAENRVSLLSQQFEELTEVQAELKVAETELQEKVAELAATRSQVASMENFISESNQTENSLKAEAATLERETKALEQQLNGVEKQIADKQTQLAEVATELSSQTEERNRIQELLDACLRPAVADETEGDSNWHQKTASILAVEPEWNYLVINRGEVDVLPMQIEAFVHRDDQFIGKIRVIQVENTVSLAEVVPGSLTPGMSIEAGDAIFF